MRRYVRALYRLLFPRLYGRQDLKVLLGAAVYDLPERLRMLAAEADQFQGTVRAIPVRAPFGESMLVVAPHQDDEAIGCGGVLLLQRKAGKAARVLLLQDGGHEFVEAGMTREELVALRNGESEAAAQVAGVSVRFLDLPRLDGARPQVVAALQEEIRRGRVDVVVSPFPFDGHPDHREAARALAEALAGIEWPVRVMTYEVWGLCIPNVAVVIDSVMEQKREMLRCFRWANAAVDYLNTTEGLNLYRARQLPAGTSRYVECFFELPKSDYIEMMDRLEGVRQ